MTDSATITGGRGPGDAHTYNPIVASGAGSFPICTPVRPSTVDGQAGRVIPTSATAFSGANVAGLAAEPGEEGSPVLTRFAGVLTATEAQWDAVTGQSGGLVTGSPYYVGSTTGTLTADAPTEPNTRVAAVGMALSPTAMMVQISPHVTFNPVP